MKDLKILGVMTAVSWFCIILAVMLKQLPLGAQIALILFGLILGAVSFFGLVRAIMPAKDSKNK